MQMWSCSCVVQSGCTRRATAEHSAEIIHQPQQGTAELLSEEQPDGHTHEYVHAHTYAFISNMTKVSPAEINAHICPVEHMHTQTQALN